MGAIKSNHLGYSPNYFKLSPQDFSSNLVPR